MRLVARMALAALVLLALTAPLGAQRLQGTVRDSLTQRAVTGAVLLQLDATGRTLARDLSDERGRYSLTLREDARRLRVLRIGFVPRTIDLTVGGTRRDIALTLLPRFLEPARVVASACSSRPDDGIAVALLEQARTGLLTAVVSREKSPASLVRLTFERRLERDGSFGSQAVRVDSARDMTESFTSALRGRDFVDRGFMDEDADGAILHGPDADVLLDDGFVAAYCFRLARGARDRPTQVGLGFVPARRKRDRVDIEGTLWVDTVARELRDIEFKYVGLHPTLERHAPGGRIGFRSMPNGMVLIDRWSLRLVGARPDTVRVPGLPSHAPPVVNTGILVSESGGELALARWTDGHAWEAPLGSLRLLVQTPDSQPAVAVTLRLDGTDYRATTDSSGHARMDRLLPGPYALHVLDPRLASIDLTLATGVRFEAQRDSLHVAAFTLPIVPASMQDHCDNRRVRSNSPRDTIPWILGRVRRSDGGLIAPGVVRVRREVRTGTWEPVSDVFRVGTDGLFWICSAELAFEREVKVEYQVRGGRVHSVDVSLGRDLTIVPLMIEP